jgi:hypothetical protein
VGVGCVGVRIWGWMVVLGVWDEGEGGGERIR